MKNKYKVILCVIFLALTLTKLEAVFAYEQIQSGDSDQVKYEKHLKNCKDTSGVGYDNASGKCTGCPAPKEANGDSCVASSDAEYLATPVIGGMNDGSSSGKAPSVPSTKKFDYKLLESFPGFYNADQTLIDLPGLVLSIYKFGIWTVGIAGLFMIVIGGIMYMSSAGNTSNASSAQGIIKDALIGIVAAMGAYLVLYVINPDFTKINLSFTSVGITEGTPMGTPGVCQALNSGDCSVANLTAAFGAAATQASSICNGESEGKAVPSNVDICADNSPASWGLFQINITVHAVGGYPCPDAFSGGGYTSKNHNCRVKPDDASRLLYQNCVNAAKTAVSNIAAAKSIYGGAGNSWKQWGANSRSSCNFK